MKIPFPFLSNVLKSWAFYDFANSSYVLIFQSFLFPAYFSSVMVEQGMSFNAWGWANGLSTLIGVLLAVFVGKIADKINRLQVFRYVVFVVFLLMVLLSLSISFFQSASYYLFVIVNSLFIVSLSISDSMLPYISSQKTVDSYSGFAWGFGYVGGIASLVIVILLQKITGNEYSPFAFLSVAIFYIVFSFIAIHGLKNEPLNLVVTDISNKAITKEEQFFLFGYWLIMESITVIILFYSIYATNELGFSSFKVGVTLLLVQLIAFPATWYMGYLAIKLSRMLILGVCIVGWGCIVYLLTTQNGLISISIIIILTGFVIGSTQSIMRSHFASLIQKSDSGFHFGMFAIAGQASAIIAPIAYAEASNALGSQKFPLISLYCLMVLGYLLIKNIDKKTSYANN